MQGGEQFRMLHKYCFEMSLLLSCTTSLAWQTRVKAKSVMLLSVCQVLVMTAWISDWLQYYSHATSHSAATRDHLTYPDLQRLLPLPHQSIEGTSMICFCSSLSQGRILILLFGTRHIFTPECEDGQQTFSKVRIQDILA